MRVESWEHKHCKLRVVGAVVDHPLWLIIDKCIIHNDFHVESGHTIARSCMSM